MRRKMEYGFNAGLMEILLGSSVQCVYYFSKDSQLSAELKGARDVSENLKKKKKT